MKHYQWALIEGMTEKVFTTLFTGRLPSLLIPILGICVSLMVIGLALVRRGMAECERSGEFHFKLCTLRKFFINNNNLHRNKFDQILAYDVEQGW